ncbi:MAG: 50S ribosomal protein L29 [Crocinitomicaceae bacterium]|nr:50S ribosomal protein L29 [Crocinitomicaceae bacterium]|tara:strand:- start:14006 stop:14206 length:201 start_codon:yes stop_codon:yes gene_type:complete
MKQSVINELKTEELFERLEDEQSSLNKLNINHVVSQLESPIVLRQKRRTIARLKTEIRKRELAQSK